MESLDFDAARHRDHRLRRYGLEEKAQGFQVLPRRSVVERALAWLNQARRLAKDYERLPETAVAMIHAVMSRISCCGHSHERLTQQPSVQRGSRRKRNSFQNSLFTWFVK
jgi:hypothetical protein